MKHTDATKSILREANMGEKNAMKRPEVRTKVKDSIIKAYENGAIMGFKKSVHFNVEDVTQRIECNKCDECGSTQNVEMHHVDGNPNNNLITNKQPLCKSCHTWKQYQPYMLGIVSVTFDAAHQLDEHEGKCRKLHGHRFKVEVTVGGRLNKKLMVFDFGIVKKVLREEIVDKLDHQFLNDVFNTSMPTCEWVLVTLFKILNLKLKGLKKVALYEGDNGAILEDSYFLEMIGEQ